MHPQKDLIEAAEHVAINEISDDPFKFHVNNAVSVIKPFLQLNPERVPGKTSARFNKKELKFSLKMTKHHYDKYAKHTGENAKSIDDFATAIGKHFGDIG